MTDISRNRSCTDIIFLLLFIVFLAAVAVCSILGAARGNAESLFFATEYSGNTCGSKNNNVAEAKRVDMVEKVCFRGS